MKKFVVCALFAVASIGAATGLMSNNTSVLGSTKNEYGCQGNCTGEYEVRHVKQILTNYPSKNNTDGVRIKARLLFKDNQYWLQDLNDTTNALSNMCMLEGRWGAGTDPSRCVGKEVGVSGVVYLGYDGSYGNIVKYTSTYTIYMVDGVVDYKVLPPVTYLL